MQEVRGLELSGAYSLDGEVYPAAAPDEPLRVRPAGLRLRIVSPYG